MSEGTTEVPENPRRRCRSSLHHGGGDHGDGALSDSRLPWPKYCSSILNTILIDCNGAACCGNPQSLTLTKSGRLSPVATTAKTLQTTPPAQLPKRLLRM
ncbi:hypothetical protein KSP40_PGU004478 [Platanthera guangdongensis]|uniref:Uncharacterized protein n=1 Tax=Platanthera guangdongensis TaxID=2320717 RepID=A0ABR2MZV4_9ASPA